MAATCRKAISTFGFGCTVLACGTESACILCIVAADDAKSDRKDNAVA